MSSSADPDPGQWSLECLVGTGDQVPSSLLCSKAPSRAHLSFLKPERSDNVTRSFCTANHFMKRNSNLLFLFPPNSTLDHNLTAWLLLFRLFIRQLVEPALLNLLRAAVYSPVLHHAASCSEWISDHQSVISAVAGTLCGLFAA